LPNWHDVGGPTQLVTSDRDCCDFIYAGSDEHLGARRQRGPGRHDVVDQEQ
jgi:hypothetical protein